MIVKTSTRDWLLHKLLNATVKQQKLRVELNEQHDELETANNTVGELSAELQRRGNATAEVAELKARIEQLVPQKVFKVVIEGVERDILSVYSSAGVTTITAAAFD